MHTEWGTHTKRSLHREKTTLGGNYVRKGLYGGETTRKRHAHGKEAHMKKGFHGERTHIERGHKQKGDTYTYVLDDPPP